MKIPDRSLVASVIHGEMRPHLGDKVQKGIKSVNVLKVPSPPAEPVLQLPAKPPKRKEENHHHHHHHSAKNSEEKSKKHKVHSKAEEDAKKAGLSSPSVSKQPSTSKLEAKGLSDFRLIPKHDGKESVKVVKDKDPRLKPTKDPRLKLAVKTPKPSKDKPHAEEVQKAHRDPRLKSLAKAIKSSDGSPVKKSPPTEKREKVAEAGSQSPSGSNTSPTKKKVSAVLRMSFHMIDPCNNLIFILFSILILRLKMVFILLQLLFFFQFSLYLQYFTE